MLQAEGPNKEATAMVQVKKKKKSHQDELDGKGETKQREKYLLI